MKKTEMLNAVESILKKAGFKVSERCISRMSCFDFMAKKENQLTLIKIPKNICCISAKDASELHEISAYLPATPLLISNKMREKLLENDTVYTRYDIYAITLKTLKDIVFHGMHPLVEAGPGGYYVNLDGEKIRERRQSLGLSIGKLSEMLGISRRTLYGYERGIVKASVSVAYNLEWILGVPVVKPINVFERRKNRETSFFSTARRVFRRNRFLRLVLEKLAHLNLSIISTERAPFDFIAFYRKEKLKIIGGITTREESSIDRRTKEIMSISNLAEAKPILITDGIKVPNNDIPSFHHEELEKIKHVNDLVSSI